MDKDFERNEPLFAKKEVEMEKREIIDIEDPQTPAEIKKATADAGISVMREVLRGIDDCVVFASTALYLQGMSRDIADLQVPPGDFDATVAKEETLSHIQERLTNVPGVEFDNDGKWKKLAGGADVLTGKIVMTIQTSSGEKHVAYPFEFFLRTMIADASVLRHQERLSGLNVLTMEGLQKQYFNNLRFESRVGMSTERVATFLMDPSIERQLQAFVSGTDDPEAQKMLDDLCLTKEDVHKFYEARNEMMTSLSQSGEQLEERLSDLATLLSGFKTKIPKRQKNLEQLRQARNMGDISA